MRALPGAAVLLDTSGRALEANDRFLALVGHLRGELTGGAPLGWWRDRPALAALVERVVRTGLPSSLDGVVTPAQDGPVPVRLDATPLPGEDGTTAVLGVLTDRSAEHRLSERLRVAVDGGVDGLLVFTLAVADGGRRVADARLADLNPRAAEILGVRVGAVLTRPLSALVEPATAAAMLALFAEARTAGRPVETTLEVALPGGGRPSLLLRATPLGSDEVVLIARDVSAQTGLEAALALLAAHAAAPLLVTRTLAGPDGTPVDALVVAADPATRRLLGLGDGTARITTALPRPTARELLAAHTALRAAPPGATRETVLPGQAAAGPWHLTALPGDLLVHVGAAADGPAPPLAAVLAAGFDNALVVRPRYAHDGSVADATVEAAVINASPARMRLDEVVGGRAGDLVEAAVLPDLVAAMGEALRTGLPVERRVDLLLRDRGPADGHDIRLRFAPLPGGTLAVTWRDLTREEAAAARLRDALEGSLEGFQVIEMVRDASGRIVDGTVVEANARIAESMGSSRERYIGTHLSDVTSDPGEILAQYEAVLAGGAPLETERAFPMGPHGQQRFIRYQMLPLDDAVAVFSRDVTERRRTEDDLRRMAEQLSFVARHSSETVSLHAPDGRFQFVSEGSRRVWGREPGDLLGHGGLDFVHGADRDALSEVMRRVREGVADEEDLTLRVLRADGAEGALDISIRAIRDGLGTLEALLWVARDAAPRLEAERRAAERVHESARRAAEQSALRRVATAAAGGGSAEAVLQVAAREAALLLEADVGLVVQLAGDVARVAGTSRDDVPPALGDALPPAAFPVLADAMRPPTRARAARPGDEAPLPGYRATVAAPVRVEGAPWGVLLAANLDERALPANAELRLQRFAEIIELALAAADARAQLATQALTDALTGLPNRRAFQERLREELGRAERHGRPVSLAVLDLDHFKRLNDVHGHQVGDIVLTEVARRLRATARAGETVARIGGEEIGWILPEADAEAAREAVERGRRAVSASPCWEDVTVTVSAGIADTEDATRPDELYRLADGALYLAKGAGRDTTRVYSPDVAPSLTARVREARIERGQTMGALRALARRVDAAHPPAAGHSERVAELARRLARAHGWSPERAQLLHEAALLHDVGKVGVPSALLRTPAPLAEAARARVQEHAALGEDATADVLTPEQRSWIRHHHEHWDGRGYPDRRAAAGIPEGARLLHVAEAWDAITVSRVHPAPLGPAAALEEMRRHSGTQFWPRAVELLARVLADDGA